MEQHVTVECIYPWIAMVMHDAWNKQECRIRTIKRGYRTLPYSPRCPNFKINNGNPGGHSAQPVPVQVCVYACTCAFVRVHVCWCACACTCMRASVVCVTVVCVTVPAHVSVRHPPNFIVAKPRKPRSLWVNIFSTIPISRRRAKKRYIPGVSTVRYGRLHLCKLLYLLTVRCLFFQSMTAKLHLWSSFLDANYTFQIIDPAVPSRDDGHF